MNGRGAVPSPFLPADQADNANHAPTDERWWQESVLFNWSDPRSGIGGQYRFNVHPNLGTATVYTWTQVQGHMVDRRMVSELPLPDADLTDASIEGLAIKTVDPLSTYMISMKTPSVSLEATWSAFMPPIAMSYNVGGATISKGHYNTLGTARGWIQYEGQEFEIHADGFMDHSWGERRVHVPGSRWMVAVFDPSFFVMAIPIITDQGRHMVGYVLDGGVLNPLRNDYSMDMSFRDDWLTPAGCDARIWDTDRRGYRIQGRTVGPSSIQPFGHGKLVTHALAEFECGGRIGRGVLESSSPRAILPSEIAELSLDPTSWWVHG